MTTETRLEKAPWAGSVRIPAGGHLLEGDLEGGNFPRGAVLFAHGSGSSRLSPRNRYVAGRLRARGVATLLFDLLTREEEQRDALTGQLRFDIDLLAGRLLDATRWVVAQPFAAGLPLGYFGASTGAAGALVAAAELPGVVRAIVSRGGRPDLAGAALPKVTAPTLLIVGGRDFPVIGMNREAMDRMRGVRELAVVPGATHLFEEPGALEEVARLATDWFARHLVA